MQEQHIQIFKNGFALVTRLFNVPAADGGSSTFSLGACPGHASLGTVWVEPAKDCEVKALSRTDVKCPKRCTSIPEILEANQGEHVEVLVGSRHQRGKIAEVSKPASKEIAPNNYQVSTGLLILVNSDEAGEKSVTVPLNEVCEVKGTAKRLKLTLDGSRESTGKHEWCIEYSGPGGIFVLRYFRKGIAWSPSYHWDTKADTKVCNLAHTATLINESEEEGHFATLSCVVGFPNMTYKDVSDPLASSVALQSFLSSLVTKSDELGGGGGYGAVPTYAARGGGYGAVPTYAAAMPMQQMAPSVMGSMGSSPEDDSSAPTIDADSDVHFHVFKSVKMQPQTRISLPIFRAEAAFKDVYCCKGLSATHSLNRPPNPSDDDMLEVWHALQVTNGTDKPWTTAPIMITSDGQYQCGSQMFYTPVKSEALVEMTKAFSVRVKRETTTTPTHEIAEVFGRRFNVTMQSTVFTIQNCKSVEVQLVLDFMLTGEIVSSEPSPKKKVEKRRYVGDPNTEHALQVEVQVPAREMKLVTIQTKLYKALPEKRDLSMPGSMLQVG